jgi:excisionase family DNA binding protein
MSTYTCPKCGNKESIRPAAKLFYTMNEVADLFGVSRLTVHRRIKGGDIKAIKFGNLVRIPAKAIKKYLAAT